MNITICDEVESYIDAIFEVTELKTRDARGCVLVEGPGYYERFGFSSIPGLIVDGVPHENVLALPFGNSAPSGTVIFLEGFAATG